MKRHITAMPVMRRLHASAWFPDIEGEFVSYDHEAFMTIRVPNSHGYDGVLFEDISVGWKDGTRC